MIFKALPTSKESDKTLTSLVDFKDEDLMLGDVIVAVDYSALKYKDAGAITGRMDVINARGD